MIFITLFDDICQFLLADAHASVLIKREGIGQLNELSHSRSPNFSPKSKKN